MAFVFIRKVSFLRSTSSSLVSSRCSKFSTSRASKFVGDRGHSVTDRLHLSPLFSESGKNDMKDCKIELVDDATWHVSSSLADAWRGNNGDTTPKIKSDNTDQEYDHFDGDRKDSHVNSNKQDPDFDEIEDMRIRGKLFYKLDKDSKEYEEYKFDFHRRNPAKNEKDRKGCKEKDKKGCKEKLKNEDSNRTLPSAKKDPTREIKQNKESKPAPLLGNKSLVSHEVGDFFFEKKERTLTFNQQTAPYHEPFCLDIYISKGSVRASIIHRATSNVVVVAHSISKDMKFDLGSTKSRNACAAVGKVLARRALDDDIHNVVYTPRKGDKLEGKLQIVLKSVMDGGVDVKVKLKQKKPRRPPTRGR